MFSAKLEAMCTAISSSLGLTCFVLPIETCLLSGVG